MTNEQAMVLFMRSYHYYRTERQLRAEAAESALKFVRQVAPANHDYIASIVEADLERMLP